MLLPPIIYWEGAVAPTGTHAGKSLTGHGELTGYGEALRALQMR